MDRNENCDEKSDNELVRLSLQNSANFYCLMKRYEKKLMTYVRNMTYLSEEDIADVVQNSFIKAFLHLNDYDCDLKFSAWIYRIVHNETVNFLKISKTRLKLAIDEDNDEIVSWLTADTDIEKDAIANHHKECIKETIDSLKSDYKEVLVLRFLEDKDYQEISDILQKPMGTVATLLSRAKSQFKEAYEKNKKCQ